MSQSTDRRQQLAADLQFALELADLADTISMTYFGRADLTVERKADDSPVSEADRSLERALRARIASERPGHGVLGEEFGDSSTPGCPRWILDPIDGTKKFVRGIPGFATLIALEDDSELVLGVASAPALGKRWWAARGLGAFADGRSIHVSNVPRLEVAHLSHGSIEGWLDGGRMAQLSALAARSGATSGYGDFWIHLLVAEGAVDAAVEPKAALWDLAPLKVIVEEAGGRLTDLEGRDTAAGGSGLSTNGLVHQEVLALLTS